jgi:hypothetical protein
MCRTGVFGCFGWKTRPGFQCRTMARGSRIRSGCWGVFDRLRSVRRAAGTSFSDPAEPVAWISIARAFSQILCGNRSLTVAALKRRGYLHQFRSNSSGRRFATAC